MRRLLLVVSLVVLVDTMLFAALGPLLPEYADEFGLSKAGAGFLVASYALGVLVGAVPAGLANARFGRRATAVTGLALMGVASVGFAFAGDEWTLGISRLVQGIGSALSWSGGLAWLVALTPRERRGEMLGTALAGAIVGAMLGPALGGVAALVGEEPAFVAVGVVNVALALAAVRTPDAPYEPARPGRLLVAFRERGFAGGLWLMFLPALLFGVVSVLVPLELDRGGWGPAAIGALFLGAAGLEALITPRVGRAFDRSGGSMRPIRIALVASAAGSIALALVGDVVSVALVVLLTSAAYGALFAPGMALLSYGAERAGLSQGLAFAVMNAAWAWGALVGPAGGGAIGDWGGDAAAYGLGAIACGATLVASSREWHSRPESATEPLHPPRLAR